MSRLSTANKPELIRYIPSGKYPPYAPFIFILSLLSFSFLTALIYGYAFGLLFGDEFGFLDEQKATRVIWLWGVQMPIIIFSSYISYKLVRKLHIRNPKAVRRWALYATVPWWIFSWVGFYLASGSEVGIINYALDRLTNGIPVVIDGRTGGFGFYAHWPVLLIGWFLEAAFIPYITPRLAFVAASFPYSENLGRWYNSCLYLPKFIRDKLQAHGYRISFCYVPDDIEDNLLFDDIGPITRRYNIVNVTDIPIVLPEECVRMIVETFTPEEGFTKKRFFIKSDDPPLKEPSQAKKAWQKYKEAKIISWSRVDHKLPTESVS